MDSLSGLSKWEQETSRYTPESTHKHAIHLAAAPEISLPPQSRSGLKANKSWLENVPGKMGIK